LGHDPITNFGSLASVNTGTDGDGILSSATGTIGTLNNDQNELLPENRTVTEATI
jgi:hypothetical protein